VHILKVRVQNLCFRNWANYTELDRAGEAALCQGIVEGSVLNESSNRMAVFRRGSTEVFEKISVGSSS
jgi:hypothetical protein